MRIAALYDIHGNLPALEAVIADVRTAGADVIVVGGDVVPGPMPREVFALLSRIESPARFIVGNGDRAVLAAARGEEPTSVPPAFRELVRWNAQQLGPAEVEAIAGWPATISIEVPGLGSVLFCHATPRNDTDIFTRDTPADRLLPLFEHGPPLVVCGHTHMQFDRQIGHTRVINAGSVGMPFGAPGAYWLLLSPEGARLRRTDYDLAGAAARVRGSAYPAAEDFAAGNILQPPSEEDMLAAYAKWSAAPAGSA